MSSHNVVKSIQTPFPLDEFCCEDCTLCEALSVVRRVRDSYGIGIAVKNHLMEPGIYSASYRRKEKFFGAYLPVEHLRLKCFFDFGILEDLLCRPQSRSRRTVFFASVVYFKAAHVVPFEDGE